MRDHICAIRYPKCVCVTLLKDRIRRILLCFFQRTVISQCLVGNHICTKPVVKVCMCVCARHIVKRQNYPQCSCVSDNSLLPIGICAIFSREQFLFQHITKKKRDILVYCTNTVFAYSKAHLTAYVSSDELIKAGIVCLPSKLL